MKKEIWLNYLESQVERCRQEGEALSQDCREDEARRAKIQGNIFQICATVYQALEAHLPPQELEAAYRRKLEVLPENWRAARDMAQAHRDMARAAVEEWKLEAWQQAWDQLGKEA